MSEKDINNLKEMLVDFNEYSTDYTKTRCRELEETIENTLKEIERLNNIIENFEIELQREIDVREEDTSLEHNTFITIQSTLKTALKRFRELKGSDSNE